MHIIDVAIIYAIHKVSTILFFFALCLIVGVETNGTCRINATHFFYHIRNHTVFLFSTFQVIIIIVELHFIIHRPEKQ